MRKVNFIPTGEAKRRFALVSFVASAALVAALAIPAVAQAQVGNYASHAASGRSVVITGASGEQLRITPYGDYIARVQVAKMGESFYADDRYHLVETHDWDGALTVTDSDTALGLAVAAADGVSLSVAKQPMRISFAVNGAPTALLTEQSGATWSGNTVTEAFAAPAADEHFAGLCHETRGHIKKLDRRGTSLKVTAGSEGGCIVPFFVSSRGYGVFLNTTFTHTINLGQNGTYSLNIDGEGYGGQLDYFFIAGPALAQVVDRYTQLTGRPRLPQRSLFGLLLSDKSDPDNQGESWWKKQITDHRNAGFAFDHQVNDNAWRASNEATSGQQNSWFEFRDDRYPDPAEYKQWCDANGVTVTLDLNRPGIDLNPTWNNNLAITGSTDSPDFTNPATRAWIWNLFFTKALDPALGYPGDSIWLDEFDYPDFAHSTTLSSGKRWAEESINYHFDLLESCVKEGWDVAIGEQKRPYFWSRGITAGAQRFGSYWSGDLDSNWSDMTDQVRAMQSAGISGFPYFNHDAGGHLNVTVNEDNLYRQWDIAFGSFTPIWKPHGPSHKRWPLQRNAACQDTAKTYITLRYQLIPYIYSYAHIAQATGMPMVRAMFLEDQSNETAWQKELQYYFGHELLVAPNLSDGGNAVSVWLPKGDWYYFWDDKQYAGDSTQSIMAATGVVPLFVRAGAIFPLAPYAKSTFQIPQDTLLIHAYAGADGAFKLYDDDGVSERFRTKDELRVTDLRYTQADLGVEIAAAAGTYTGAPTARSYQVAYHGLTASSQLYVNGVAIPSVAAQSDIAANADGAVWDDTKKLLNVYLAARPVDTRVKISINEVDMGTGGAAGASAGGASGTGGASAGGATGTPGGMGPGGSGTLPGGGAPGTSGAGGSSTAGGANASGGAGASMSGGRVGTSGGSTAAGASAGGAAGSKDEGGCGCRMAANTNERWLPLAGLLAAFALRRRTRWPARRGAGSSERRAGIHDARAVRCLRHACTPSAHEDEHSNPTGCRNARGGVRAGVAPA